MKKGPYQSYRSLVDSGELSEDPCQEQAALHLQDLHEALGNFKPGRRGGLFGLGKPQTTPTGLYLYGGVGRGKSMLMDLFYDLAPVSNKRRVHFHAFMLEIHDAIAEWRGLTENQRKRRANYVRGAGDDPIAPVARGVAQAAQLLCFDEFQVTDIADAMILGRLFEQFFEDNVVVVATSNRSPDELYEGGLNRQLFLPFVEMVKQQMDVLHLNGPRDYRLERISGAPVYYYPLNEETKAQMDAAWMRLTDCEFGHPETLKVKSRSLHVPQAAKGAARFAFLDLAGQPLGAADYLCLAQEFHTLFVDGIPQMSREQLNEAKRFVTLIDTLYENNVKLICSAAALPQELYPDGDGSFEFQRTVSRLVEMQSEDYLATGHGLHD